MQSQPSANDAPQAALTAAMRLKRTVAVIASLALVAVALAAHAWKPDLLAALTLIPAWLVLAAGLVSTSILWRLWLRTAAKWLFITWLLFGGICVEEFRSLARLIPRQSGTASGAIRIVSLNCAGEAKCLTDLQRANPDIVLLQEIPSNDQLRRLTRELFGDAGTEFHGADTAILARGRLSATIADEDGQYASAIVSLDDGTEVACVSLRLAPPPSRMDFWMGGFWAEHRDLRILHQKKLRTIFTHTTKFANDFPFVIGGDFNTVPADRALDELRTAYDDAFAKSGAGWGATGTNDWPLFRVDQVWTNSGATPIRAKAGRSVASDHRIVIVDLTVNRK